MVAVTADQAIQTEIERPFIKYHALNMIVGMSKTCRHFYDLDIETLIEEARVLGTFLHSSGFCGPDAELTVEQSNAVRVAFYTQDFRDIDARWLECYDEKRITGQQPDAGIPQEAWWDKNEGN